jgi:hypothetical protein
MKRSLLIAFVLLSGANIVIAQPPGSIGLFADPGATICDVSDQYPSGVRRIYVVHVNTPGAYGAQFRVDHVSWGANLTYLTESVTWPYVAVGSSITGIQIGYGGCIPSPNMIMYIDFWGSGQSPPCSYIQVVPHLTATPPGILVPDCNYPDFNLVNATGGDVVVNPDASCHCDIPVHETTWGQVKALYQ